LPPRFSFGGCAAEKLKVCVVPSLHFAVGWMKSLTRRFFVIRTWNEAPGYVPA
jgi:hypothetical protein